MHNKFLKKILGIATFFLMATTGIATAATLGGGFTFGPTYPQVKEPKVLYYELKPGDSVTDYVTATNKSDAAVTFNVYPADTSYSKDLQIVFGRKNDPRGLESAWIKMDESDFTLQPNEKKVIPFTLTVPTTAQPSDKYLAGIILENIPPESKAKLQTNSAIVIPAHLKVTWDPQQIARYGQTNIWAGFKTPYFWFSFALFTLGIAYYIEGQHKEHRKRLKELKEKRN